MNEMKQEEKNTCGPRDIVSWAFFGSSCCHSSFWLLRIPSHSGGGRVVVRHPGYWCQYIKNT
jgi:hypothetical protein